MAARRGRPRGQWSPAKAMGEIEERKDGTTREETTRKGGGKRLSGNLNESFGKGGSLTNTLSGSRVSSMTILLNSQSNKKIMKASEKIACGTLPDDGLAGNTL